MKDNDVNGRKKAQTVRAFNRSGLRVSIQWSVASEQ